MSGKNIIAVFASHHVAAVIADQQIVAAASPKTAAGSAGAYRRGPVAVDVKHSCIFTQIDVRK